MEPIFYFYNKKKLSLRLSPPPLTEPEENAVYTSPTVRMMGTVGMATFKETQARQFSYAACCIQK